MVIILSSITFTFFICFIALSIWFARTFKEADACEVLSLTKHLSVKTLLVVLAHPDDEIFIAGVLADSASQEGLQIYIITASKGRGGVSFGKQDEGTHLAEQRCSELAAHLALLKVKNFEILDFDDGRLAKQQGEITSILVARICQINPDTVLTFDPQSGYTGHPDHVAIGKATFDAIRIADESKPKTGEAAKVNNLVFFLVPHIAIGLFGGQRGKIVAKNQVSVQFAVKIDPALKIRGWKTHVSQSSYLWKVYNIPPWILYRFFTYEYFFVHKLSS